jgi:hypothetical protein
MDGDWDLIESYERRFCIEHEEDEWLLRYADRWIYFSDFGEANIESILEVRLQKYS